MEALRENIAPYLEVLGALIALITVIAAVTPSNKDDTLIQKVGKWADRLGIKIKK